MGSLSIPRSAQSTFTYYCCEYSFSSFQPHLTSPQAERRRERAVLMAALPPSKGAPAGGDGGFGFGEGRGGKRYNSGYGHAPPKRGRTSY